MKPLYRYRILISGIVQGVGFRPFLYRAAHDFKLFGSVKNTTRGVILEVEGKEETIKDFISFIRQNPPPLSKIESFESFPIDPLGDDHFEILASEEDGLGDLLVSPDIAICDNCKRELFSPSDRRYLYPFINCTDCGPRFSIIQDLPYDRPKTTMKDFQMCSACQEEYKNPFDRRYHAQPVSCYDCGPLLFCFDVAKDEWVKDTNDPVEWAASQLKANRILAIKGLGGYHLACRASDAAPVTRLRELKGRETKPFAMMGTLEMIKRCAVVSEAEEKLLSCPASPILLLKKKADAPISHPIAPGLEELGFMLPYTPLHLLLLDKVNEPLVMTSANVSDEPIIYRDNMAKKVSPEQANSSTPTASQHEDRLPGSFKSAITTLCDCVLTNDREIYMFADDSVARVFAGQPYLIRRSRGYTPMPLKMPLSSPQTILALGPMLKTTFCFWDRDRAFMSQYIGDTDSPASIEAERRAIRHFTHLFGFQPKLLVLDKHPGYPNRTLTADFTGVPVVEIQHHKAHVGALLAEWGELGKVFGIAMDGTGYGDDGTIWGGEFFVGDYQGLERFGHLQYLFLPSGDKAAKEPWRFALSVLHAIYGAQGKTIEWANRFGKKGELLLEVIEKEAGGILTSSCGRIFDAAAALLGIGDMNSYEGEMPIKLQAFAEGAKNNEKPGSYEFVIDRQGAGNGYRLDLRPMFDDMVTDNRDRATRALMFHHTLARSFVDMAERARQEMGIHKVGLTGGVFQNALLLRLSIDYLEAKGFEVLYHREVPTNDGGVSLGQAFLSA